MKGYTEPLTDTSAAADAIALHAEQLTGIVLSKGGAAMIGARIGRRLTALGLADLDAYLALLRSPAWCDERHHFISAVTTNESSFFREPHHFDHLRNKVLPPLIARARCGGRVRLWSAGCAGGQEALSLAMVVLDMLPDAERHDLSILATDIDRAVLKRARCADFSTASLASVPAEMRSRFFSSEGNMCRPTPALRKLVRFRELNLQGHWPMHRPFDIIVCRNVAIYFAPETQRRLWRRFADALTPGGRLYVGHSEQISTDSGLPLRWDDVSCYQRLADEPEDGARP
ncbi:CheR family methyltransferase [Defluviimonas salinarum]|uniref:Chemotaxis protein methyltransferase n=1 Tax=Defluviimonas salinarum TaxID=2992147 RepID=A0ABT3IY41_9RHOB|nr:protein-glutamate O-methyltransferase [Defluviimonas salinarum]MCW3780115.1 protein-glutamate O-methyltransferase [Defluviimonas salinarum]